MTSNIVMLCSLDTKAAEAQYLADCIAQQGADPISVDIGYGRPPEASATISAADVAQAAGSDIDSVYAMDDTGAASTLMMQGAIILVQQLIEQGRCDGIIAFGGASNTTVATGVMKAVPIGIPKLMISSAAAMPAYSGMYFGSRDITIMNAVVDMSGLNEITRAILKRGAGGICGMAAVSDGGVEPSRDSQLIAVSSFRFSDACSQQVMKLLEERGYTPLPFHAQGVGENAMENLVGQGMFLGVIDVVPAGLSERMLGGNRAAKPDRLEAAGRVGIPQVIATSGFDMISCGPIARRDRGDPLWQQRRLAERQYMIPDRFRVEARTTAEEVAEIGWAVAEKLNRAGTPARVVVPTRGWSTLSVEGAELYNPKADAAFVPALREALDDKTRVLEVDAELNSERFARTLVDELLAMLEPTAGTPQ